MTLRFESFPSPFGQSWGAMTPRYQFVIVLDPSAGYTVSWKRRDTMAPQGPKFLQNSDGDVVFRTFAQVEAACRAFLRQQNN